MVGFPLSSVCVDDGVKCVHPVPCRCSKLKSRGGRGSNWLGCRWEGVQRSALCCGGSTGRGSRATILTRLYELQARREEGATMMPVDGAAAAAAAINTSFCCEH